MSWWGKRALYNAMARNVEPAVRLTTKDHWVWGVIGALVHVCTFGGTTRHEFLTRYGTTIGPVVAVPREWPSLSPGFIVHEATHAADMRRASFGIHPWAGLPFYGLAYLLLPLPMGFAFFRYWLELRADRAAWRHELRRGHRSPDGVTKRAQQRGDALKGGAYGFAWLWARGGYARAAKAVLEEFGYGG